MELEPMKWAAVRALQICWQFRPICLSPAFAGLKFSCLDTWGLRPRLYA